MTLLLRLFDVRPAEVRSVLAAFASLLLIVVAHTTLETVRDALFLVHVGPGALGYMYIVSAGLTLAIGSVSANFGARVGPRRALLAAQVVSAAGAAMFFFLPPARADLVGLYVFSAVSGALLVPQLWATTAALFHTGQGRRLFGTIALAGVLGAVLGTSATAGALMMLDLRWLFLLSAAAFALSAVAIALAPAARSSRAAPEAPPAAKPWAALREEPILARLAVAVALGTATSLFADYLFKAVATAKIAPDHLGLFFARTYTAMNVLALLAQLLLARRVLARAGVIGTAGFMPSLMLLGSVLGFVSGGALVAVLFTRAVDGAFRHSVNRTGLELVYMAVPARARDRARPLIDGAIARLSQAAAAGLILLLARIGAGSPRELAFVAACCAFAWFAVNVSLRGPYLALFRRALLGPDSAEPRSAEELDLASVEILVEALSSPRPREAIAAMDALARRGRAGLVPALILLRDEEEVIERSLQIFGVSKREDWIQYCERFLADRRERVRRAAMRALARARRNRDAEPQAREERPWLRGYLAIDAVIRDAPGEDPIALLTPDADGREAALGMLTAFSDAPAEPRLASLLVRVVEAGPQARGREAVELVARAAASVRATELVPRLVDLLLLRDDRAVENVHGLWRGPAEGRAQVRAALAALGAPAFEHVAALLSDPSTPRRLRMHLPAALAKMGTQESADLVFAMYERGDDGLVRYRCLRASERLAVDHGVRFASGPVRAAIRRELTEHFRLMALAGALSAPPSGARGEDVRALVVRLLDEKRAQALTRVFCLLKVLHPDEDLHQVHTALTSDDAQLRADAAEFLDALLAPRRRGRDDGVRALLRLVAEDAPDTERVARAVALGLPAHPPSVDAAIAAMQADRDATLAALAASLDRDVPRRPSERAESEAPLVGILRPAGAHGH
jgi:AAA family ATP:ADP antiporter